MLPRRSVFQGGICDGDKPLGDCDDDQLMGLAFSLKQLAIGFRTGL
jgi:hypothetical protein